MTTEVKIRDLFEDVTLVHMVQQRALGKVVDDNGAPATKEAMFWLKENGDYGVEMFNAAWWGFKTAMSMRIDRAKEVLTEMGVSWDGMAFVHDTTLFFAPGFVENTALSGDFTLEQLEALATLVRFPEEFKELK